MDFLETHKVHKVYEQLSRRRTPGHDSKFTPLVGGRNNRTFKVTGPDEELVLKIYFQHDGDTRDRYGTESAFLFAASRAGVSFVPKPFAFSPELKAGLMEYIPGLPVTDVSSEAVGQALQFLSELQKIRNSDAVLPIASEAAFSLEESLQFVERRLKFVQEHAGHSTEKEFQDFVWGRLVPVAEKVFANAESKMKSLGLDRSEVLSQADRILSPSDFGFHNALRLPDGSVRFVDFEYAGWDDPAKCFCDFFCQTRVPVPSEHRGIFLDTLLQHVQHPERLRSRADLLMPIYQLKWACIFMNEFLPVGASRRKFASELTSDIKTIGKHQQLEKAENMLQTIEASQEGTSHGLC